MAYRAFRPNSASHTRVKKHRTQKLPCDAEKALNFNPWASSYKENFCLRPPKTEPALDWLKGTKAPEAGGLSVQGVGLMNPKVTRPQSSCNPALKTEKKPAETPVPKRNNFMETGPKPAQNRPSCNENLMKTMGAQPSRTSGIRDFLPAREDAVTTEERKMSMQAAPPAAPPKGKAQEPSLLTAEGLEKEIPELKTANEAPPFQNVLGQPEDWLDAKDKVNPPVHSRLVNYIPKEFLRANVKVLVNSVNEYYPYLTGVCLCNQCICGNCRCVHFKYRIGQNCFSQVIPALDDFSTEYKREFKPKKMAGPSRHVQPNELAVVPFKLAMETSNSRNFRPPSGAGAFNGPLPLSRARVDNIGPGVCPVRCPLDSLTCNRQDYPDWKCVGAQPLPRFVPNTSAKNMPFMGKPVNREYGAFFARGEQPEVREGCFPENRNNVFPAPAIEFPNETDYQRNYKPKNLGDDPLSRFRPIGNLELEVS